MQQGYRYHHNHRIGRQWRKETDVEHMVIRQTFVLPLEVVFVTYIYSHTHDQTVEFNLKKMMNV